MKKRKSGFTLLCFLLAVFLLSASQSSAISISKEKELAREYMEKIRQKYTIIKDPVVCRLVEGIGREILARVPPQPFEFSFYVLDNADFNAFAAPGANICINRGLIEALDSVDQLAGILGHEIAHAASRHVSQLIDQSKIVSIGTLAGILAGILVGSSGEEDMGEAITVGSVAAAETTILAYTREHEKEADQKGFDYLAQTRFSPRGLLTGLQKIRERDYYGMDDIPDYFKTHPGTKKRIAFLENLLEKRGIETTSGTDCRYRFDMVKYRLIGLYNDPGRAEEMISKRLEHDDADPALLYGLALALERQSEIDAAVNCLKKALVSNFSDPLLLLEIGRMYLLSDAPEKAEEVLRGIEDDPLVEIQAAYYLGQARIQTGHPGKAGKNLEKVIERAPDLFPKAYYHMAQLYAETEEKGLMHYYLGIYYVKSNQVENGRLHLRNALKTLTDKEKIEKAKKLLGKNKPGKPGGKNTAG